MVEAARKYNRVVQLGTQRRSTPHVIRKRSRGSAAEASARSAWPAPGSIKKRKTIGHGKPGPVPAGVDYAMWQGPAPDRPFYPNRFHYNWHWFWNWGTGELGNNGIHGVDVARWGLGVDAPIAVSSGGGKYVFDDDQEVPDTQTVTWEFPGACLAWEHRMWSNHGTEGSGFGIAFYGDKGTLIIDDKGWRVEQGDGSDGQAHRRGPGAARPELPRLRQEPREAQRRHRDRPPEHPAVPPGQHRLPHRQEAHLRRGDRIVPRRPRPMHCSPASTAAGSKCRRRFEDQESSSSRQPCVCVALSA